MILPQYTSLMRKMPQQECVRKGVDGTLVQGREIGSDRQDEKKGNRVGGIFTKSKA